MFLHFRVPVSWHSRKENEVLNPPKVVTVPLDLFCNIIGVSNYLEAGTHRDVTIELFDVPGKEFDRSRLTESQDVASAELHRDTNDNERFDFLTSDRNADSPYYVPYGVSGDTVLQKGPDIDIAVIAIGESVRAARGIGPTPTGTAMAAGAGGAAVGSAQAGTPIRTQPNADSSPTTTDNTGKSGPGFGVLVAIIALLSGLVLARRV